MVIINDMENVGIKMYASISTIDVIESSIKMTQRRSEQAKDRMNINTCCRGPIGNSVVVNIDGVVAWIYNVNALGRTGI